MVLYDQLNGAISPDSGAIAGRHASQKASVDEAYQKGRANELRQRNVDALRAVGTRWSAALAEASGTPRSEIAAPLKKLQALKSEADTIEVEDCMGAARKTLQSAMAATIDALSSFQKETGVSADTTSQKIQQGADLLQAALQQMDECRSK